MVDLTRLTVSKGLPATAHNSKTTGHHTGSETVQSQEFNKLFKQGINKVATPESGIRKSEYGETLPNNSAPLITLESKSLRGGMLLLVGGDEPTNDVIEEFAQSQGVDAELIALLMKDPSSASERKPSALNLAQQSSLLSNEEPVSQEKTPRGLDLLMGAVKETTKQNTPLTATPSKFIATDSISAKGPLTQPQYVTQLEVTGKQTSNHVAEGDSLLSQEKTPRGLDLLMGAVKETTKQNTPLTATPSKFIATESIAAKGPLTQPQPSQALHNLSLPLNPDNPLLEGEYDDGILAHTKNADSLVTLTDVTGKRTSVERPDEILMIKQEQHADMSKKLAEALGQRLTAQIAKGVWQVELDIHPKSLGRIEIHLEMRGGELEAHFNASKALTRELLQDGMPRLKEELREHGIETAYLGLGSGKQGKNGGNSTPYDNEDVAERQSKATVLEPKIEVGTQKNLIDGLDITI